MESREEEERGLTIPTLYTGAQFPYTHHSCICSPMGVPGCGPTLQMLKERQGREEISRDPRRSPGEFAVLALQPLASDACPGSVQKEADSWLSPDPRTVGLRLAACKSSPSAGPRSSRRVGMSRRGRDLSFQSLSLWRSTRALREGGGCPLRGG